MMKLPPMNGINRMRLTVALSITVCTIAGCSPSENEKASSAALIGATGGTLTGSNATLTVPAGAVDTPIEFFISSATPTEPAGVTFVGPGVEIGPGGTQFAVSADVAVPFNPANLPEGTSANAVAVFTSASAAGPFTPLSSTITGNIARASVDHLSYFVAGIANDAPIVCGMGSSWESCGCSDYLNARPLDIVSTTSLERTIQEVCFNVTNDSLIVRSYTTSTGSDGNTVPDQYYRTELDGKTLEKIAEIEIQSGEIFKEKPCAPYKPADLLRDTGWSARTEAHTVEGWWEYLLDINDLSFSFNRELNTTTPVDSSSFRLTRNNTAVARIQENGTARFYFHAYHGGTLDILVIDDLPAMTSNPPAPDKHGLQTPSFRKRLTFLNEEQPLGYNYPSLVVLPANDDPAADIVVYFTRKTDGVTYSDIGAVRVEGTGSGTLVTELPPLSLDTFWTQSGWHNMGMGGNGLLYAQSNVASFSNGFFLIIDPQDFSVVTTVELGCIEAPLSGAMTIPWSPGQIARFGFSPDFGDESWLSFIRDGTLQASGAVPFNGSFEPHRLVSTSSLALLWTWDPSTGDIAAIRIP